MGTSLVSSNPPLDTTLTKSGQAADAKAVGDKFNEAKLVVKVKEYIVTTDVYAQANIDLPEDFIVLSFIECDSAIIWIQNFNNSQFSVRCFGPVARVELNGLRNTTFTLYLHYLAKSN